MVRIQLQLENIVELSKLMITIGPNFIIFQEDNTPTSTKSEGKLRMKQRELLETTRALVETL